MTGRNAGLRKRSLALAGHRTSVALEGPFWAALERAAGARGLSLAALVARIDAERSAPGAPPMPLASALRLFALAEAEQAAAAAKAAQPEASPLASETPAAHAPPEGPQG